jgi:hypothetical protein
MSKLLNGLQRQVLGLNELDETSLERIFYEKFSIQWQLMLFFIYMHVPQAHGGFL